MQIFLLCLYIVTVLIRPQDWWEPLLGWELVTLGAIAVGVVGLPIILSRFTIVWNRLPQMKAALVFLIACSLSYLHRAWFGGMIIAFQEVGKVMFFFALVLVLTRNMTDYRFLLWSFLLSVMWLAIHAVMQQHLGYGFGNQLPLWRVTDPETREGLWQSIAFGTLNDPNDLCTVFIVAIPLYYVQFKILANPMLKVLSVIGVSLSAYGAWCTNSRGGVMSLFGMIAAYSFTRTKGFARYLTVAVGISTVTILAPSRFSGSLAGKDRAVLWGDGLAMFKANPIFGVGYNLFPDYSDEHRVAHNTYIHTLAELGLLGYLALFLILYLTMIQLRRTINCKQQLDPKDHLLLMGVFASIAGYFTGLYFLSRQYQHILYLVISLSITAVCAVCDKYSLNATVFGESKRDIQRGLVWGLGSVVLMWITVRIANAIS